MADEIIKGIVYELECLSCGTINKFRRTIVVDEFLKNIPLVKRMRCACGNTTKFRLIDFNMEKGKEEEKG